MFVPNCFSLPTTVRYLSCTQTLPKTIIILCIVIYMSVFRYRTCYKPRANGTRNRITYSNIVFEYRIPMYCCTTWARAAHVVRGGDPRGYLDINIMRALNRYFTDTTIPFLTQFNDIKQHNNIISSRYGVNRVARMSHV